MSFHQDSFHQTIGKFNKKLKTSRGEINFHAEYDNDYLTIVIDKWQFIDTGYPDAPIKDQIMTTNIFEGKISLKTEIDESGEIILPDWIQAFTRDSKALFGRKYLERD